MTARTWKRIGLVSCCAIGSLVLLAASPEQPRKGDEPIRVTLTRRVKADVYETSAYSFRYASQDVEVHKNHVDLGLGTCGRLHVSFHGGQENQIARVGAKKLDEVQSWPAKGWQKSCVNPEKDAVYVMDVNDGKTRSRVKFRIVEAKPDKVTIEWAPFRDELVGKAGTSGLCGGEHDCN